MRVSGLVEDATRAYLGSVSEIVSPSDPVVKQVARDLIRAFGESDALGIAAPQIGVNMRVVIIGNMVMFNPAIRKALPGRFTHFEGCLSYPGKLYSVERYETVWVEYTDWKGELCLKKFTGLSAAVAQHEVDHLNGVTIPALDKGGDGEKKTA